MNQLITLLTIRTPRRQIMIGLTLYSLIAGVLPYPPQINSMIAFGEVVPCQDDGFGCEEPLLVLSEPDPTGFDREVFSSDGSNTAEVFDAGSYFQAGFRLARSAGGENFVSDWDTFLDIVNLLKNTADSMHGIPLLITKTQFTAPEAMPGPKTFFMAALAAKTISHSDITILTSRALQLSDDPVESIRLQVEGTTVTVDPSGNTPLHFSSGGEKTVLAIVRFASGFVGQNLFRLVVDAEE